MCCQMFLCSEMMVFLFQDRLWLNGYEVYLDCIKSFVDFCLEFLECDCNQIVYSSLKSEC